MINEPNLNVTTFPPNKSIPAPISADDGTQILPQCELRTWTRFQGKAASSVGHSVRALKGVDVIIPYA